MYAAVGMIGGCDMPFSRGQLGMREFYYVQLLYF
jgi:hypothetical protein